MRGRRVGDLRKILTKAYYFHKVHDKFHCCFLRHLIHHPHDLPSMSCLRQPYATFRCLWPLNSPKLIRPCDSLELYRLALACTQLSVVSAATMRPTIKQLPKKVANTIPLVFRLISAVVRRRPTIEANLS